jgi:hypothetical protein
VIAAGAALDNSGLPVPQQLGAGPADLWMHVTITPAMMPYLVLTPIEATKVVLLERDGVPVHLTRGREASTEPGAYDLLHAGSGYLVFPIPPTDALGLAYGTAGSPVHPLELWLLAGPSAVR